MYIFSFLAAKISLLCLPLVLGTSAAFAQTGKVRMGMPSYSLVVLAPLVAQAKGFFHAEGLEVELIRMATPILDRVIAEGSYDLYARAMSPDGLVREGVLESDIEGIRRELQIKEKVAITKVADLTLLREALNEMKLIPSSP